MSSYESPKDRAMEEIHQSLNELIEMGLVEVIGINDDGEWLYGVTPAGKEALELWEE